MDNNYTTEIVVQISNEEFIFDDLDTAVMFAKLAIKTGKSVCYVFLDMEFKVKED